MGHLKTEVVQIRLSSQEKAVLVATALKAGMTLTEYIKAAITVKRTMDAINRNASDEVR